MRRLAAMMLGGLCAACAGAQHAPPAGWTGQAPAVAAPFAPGIVARPDTEESMLTVGSNGDEIFWGVSRVWFPMSRVSEIWTARRTPGGWSRGERASFSFGYSDGDPFVSPDGRRVFFVSVRPVGAPRRDFDLYVVERTADGWSPARNLGRNVNSPEDELYPSVAADGTLYFASERSGVWHIYRARPQADGSYGQPEVLPGAVNLPRVWSFNPFISADGRTLVFTSLNRPGGLGKGDIWIAEANAAGVFDSVRNAGPMINTAEEEFHPTLSPDRRALFFVRRNTSRPDGNADVFWIRPSAIGL
jgi:Tol biopolymer transport system component